MGLFQKTLMGMLGLGFIGSNAFALIDDLDEEPQAPTAAVASNKASNRSYAGGREEQDLAVQPSLPQPSRSPDGVAQPVAPSGGDASHD